MIRAFAIGIHMSAIFIMAIMVFIFLTRLKSTRREFLVLFTISGLLYTVGALFELMATTDDGAMFGLILVALGVLLAPTFLYFLQQYFQQQLPKVVNFVMFSSAFLIIVLLWTTRWHELMYSTIHMLPADALYYSLYRWDVTRGPLFPLTVIHPIICVVVTLILLARKAKNSDGVQKKKLRTLIFCTAFPVIPHVIILVNIPIIPDMHFVAIFVAISNVIIYRGIYKHDLIENENEREAIEINEVLLRTSPFIMNIWDESINLVATSEQSVRMFELSSQEQYIERFGELSPEYQPCGTLSSVKAEAYVRQAFRDGYVQFEWLHQNLDGELLPTEITIARFTRQGKNFAAAYTVDLRPVKETAEKAREAEMYRREAAEESSRAKSRFLARMSHEIRTPVTAVMGISEIQLQNPSLQPQTEEAFAKIHSSAHLLLSIINDILDHSKIEANKMEIAEEEYEIASLISDVAQLHLAYLDDKDIAFRISVDENLPVVLIGDVLRIEQIIGNLLSNAFKYTMVGAVELSFQSQKDQARDDYTALIVTVRDTGLGMTPTQLGSLYTEYERFHMGEVSAIAGTGLGMSIVLGLLQMMDARIDMESEVGKGTTAIIHIPQKVIGNELLGKKMAGNLQRFENYTHAAAKRFKFVPEPMPYGKVLVVDDVDANLYVAKGLLAFYDINVETCESGQQAIDKVKEGNVYDIVFMDHMMSGLDGIETMRIMRDMGYSQPIVALTANALVGQAEKFIESGFDGFISKPIQTKRLNTILMKHIRDKQPPEVIAQAISSKGKVHSNKGSIDDYLNGVDLRNKLQSDFVRSNKKSANNIKQAINNGDMKTARRLAHSLKGSAGLIHETSLARVAEQVEIALSEGKLPTDSQLVVLELELSRVLESIDTPETTFISANKDFDNVAAVALLDELHPLLQLHNIESLSLIDELRAIPEAAVLVRQIEDFDFAPALKTLETLRTIWDT